MKLVIALGGNAILKKGEKATIDTQITNTERAMKKLYPVIRANDVILTHGNGPQAGYLLLQQELAKKEVSRMPLDVLDAETEGQIGYIIQQNLYNLFQKTRLKKNIVTVLTQVLVSKNDPAFYNPGKFVGPFYTKAQANKLMHKFRIKQDVGRGYRRVVASPKPIQIIETDVIKDLLRNNCVVIAAGGGGIPVVKGDKGLEGIEAVIDKDLASQCLANSVRADVLIMITDVPGVYLDFKTGRQRMIRKIRLKDIKLHYETGQFPAGNMGPKIEAAIRFLEKGGKKVIITNIDDIDKTIRKEGGTVIVR